MSNTVVWFELPVTDLNRAMKFYSSILEIKMKPMENGPSKMALFPVQPGEASGALVQSKERVPSDQGSLIYLNGGDDLSVPLGRVEAAGGKVLQEKTNLGEYGFIGSFLDSEGNRVAFHNKK